MTSRKSYSQRVNKKTANKRHTLCNDMQAGVVQPSDPLTAEGSISGGGYEPRDRHKQWLDVFIGFHLDVRYFTYLTDFVNAKIGAYPPAAEAMRMTLSASHREVETPFNSRMWVPFTKTLKYLRRLPSESNKCGLSDGYRASRFSINSETVDPGTMSSLWLST